MMPDPWSAQRSPHEAVSAVSAVPLTNPCWELDRRPGDERTGDEYVPHFATDEEALTEAAVWVEDDERIPVVAQLRTPCWVATCAGCDADMEHTEYGTTLHYPDGGAVDDDADALTCTAGCAPPDAAPSDGALRDVGHLEDSSALMDPLPGLDQALDPAQDTDLVLPHEQVRERRPDLHLVRGSAR